MGDFSGHAESYNPPKEYLPSEQEKLQWEMADAEDRPYNFIPQQFDALRQVPSYSDSLKERFERCLDLYLCPRTRKKRLNIDPGVSFYFISLRLSCLIFLVRC